ncbi:hypothetical protein [Zavarzinia sp. CC-PAN008]|uniref:hypothetical protein n=1 Tax=Zavarzinia sp. CC-PAN008 TaxID=3243332 RepID=UPI003F744134
MNRSRTPTGIERPVKLSPKEIARAVDRYAAKTGHMKARIKADKELMAAALADHIALLRLMKG